MALFEKVFFFPKINTIRDIREEALFIRLLLFLLTTIYSLLSILLSPTLVPADLRGLLRGEVGTGREDRQ
jgi:hypothetical protein